MPKTTSKRPARKAAARPKARKQITAGRVPLAPGQVWNIDGQHLLVLLVGKLLVHYKLGAPKAVRVNSSVGGRGSVEKFLKKHKAWLLKTVKIPPGQI